MNFSKNDQRRVLLIDRDSLKQKLRAAALLKLRSRSSHCQRRRRCRSPMEGTRHDLVLLAAQENSEKLPRCAVSSGKASPSSGLPFSWELQST